MLTGLMSPKTETTEKIYDNGGNHNKKIIDVAPCIEEQTCNKQKAIFTVDSAGIILER